MKKCMIVLPVLILSAILGFNCAQADGLTPYEPGSLQGIDVTAPQEIQVDLGGYETKEIQGIDVTAPQEIHVDLGGYETKEIQGIGVTAPQEIQVDFSGYETKEIQGIDVSAPQEIQVDLGGYETKEIQGIDVSAPKEIHIDLGEYVTREIENIDVRPIEQIRMELTAYNVPDITDIAPEPIQTMYINLVEYLGEADRQRLSDLSPIEVKDYVQKYSDLIDDLNVAFELEGIRASIDPVSGRIPIDASLLYATNEYKVTEDGKRILRDVFRVYCSVLSREEYRDYISNVVIIGHTDTNGSYDYNVTLSMNRANAVKEFCLSEECGVEDIDWLAPRLVAEGHSYDELIYNADGTENKAASRRVELGFTLAI